MKLRIAVVALTALGGVALASGSASAMPNGIANAGQVAGQSSNLEQVAWICNGWGRCWHRPNWYGAYGYYGPRPWGWHPWGWRRWHYWHRW
jgi:hypothetical protein